MSSKNEQKISNNQYSLWSGMAGGIVALIMSAVLSINDSSSSTTTPAVQELIKKFSQDANKFVAALNSFYNVPRLSLPQTETIYLAAPPTRADYCILNDDECDNKKIELTVVSGSIKENTSSAGSKIVSFSEDLASEETSYVCVVKEEISEVSNYTVNPVTNVIKVSTVEEYSNTATRTMLKSQGVQAFNFKEEEVIIAESQNNESMKLQEQERLKHCEEMQKILEEPETTKVDAAQPKLVNDLESSTERITDITLLPEDTLALNTESEIKTIEATSRKSNESTADEEAKPIKDLSDTVGEFKSLTIPKESENLQPKISDPSLSEESLLKQLTETFSKIKAVSDVPNRSLKSDTNDTLLSPSIEEIILKKLTEAFPDLNTKQLITSDTSVNTIEKFPEPVEKADVAVEANPERWRYSVNVSTQKSQVIILTPSEIKQVPDPANKKTKNINGPPSNKGTNVKKSNSKERLEKAVPKKKLEPVKILPKRKDNVGPSGEVNVKRNVNRKEPVKIKPTNNIPEAKRRNPYSNKFPARPGK